LALEILNQSQMVRWAEFGTPSAFLLKRETRAIKELAQQFAARLGDTAFAAMVEKAMDAQRQTVAKRQAARIGR
jgi:hypothetical protein